MFLNTTKKGAVVLAILHSDAEATKLPLYLARIAGHAKPFSFEVSWNGQRRRVVWGVIGDERKPEPVTPEFLAASGGEKFSPIRFASAEFKQAQTILDEAKASYSSQDKKRAAAVLASLEKTFGQTVPVVGISALFFSLLQNLRPDAEMLIESRDNEVMVSADEPPKSLPDMFVKIERII